jgi:hypothetical protein
MSGALPRTHGLKIALAFLNDQLTTTRGNGLVRTVDATASPIRSRRAAIG